MAEEGIVVADDGTRIELRPDTICLHGDTPGAVDMALRVREALENAGVRIVPLEKTSYKMSSPKFWT
jgi:UPF0271 protein